MPRTTLYVVQGVSEDELGQLVREEPVEFSSAGDAQRRAQTLASTQAGVVVWARSGDPDTGDWDEPRVVFRAGRFGDD